MVAQMAAVLGSAVWWKELVLTSESGAVVPTPSLGCCELWHSLTHHLSNTALCAIGAGEYFHRACSR